MGVFVFRKLHFLFSLLLILLAPLGMGLTTLERAGETYPPRHSTWSGLSENRVGDFFDDLYIRIGGNDLFPQYLRRENRPAGAISASGVRVEGFRYRDLETGTFITRDPLGFVDGPNVYTYVRQNPKKFQEMAANA